MSSPKLLKNVFIDHKDKYIQLSDNYFDLLPNKPVTVKLIGGIKLAEIKDGLKFNSVLHATFG